MKAQNTLEKFENIRTKIKLLTCVALTLVAFSLLIGFSRPLFLYVYSLFAF